VHPTQAHYFVAMLSLTSGCSLDVAGLPGAGCGDHVVDPGEACDDSSPFCDQCQLVCPAGWVKSPSAATCYKVFPPRLGPGTPDWGNTKSWASAGTACAAEAPSTDYAGRLAGPGVLDVLLELTDCPRSGDDGKSGGCWTGARCPDGMMCANRYAVLEWSGLSAQAIPASAWSDGNPSGDGSCVEYIPSEGINDDSCDKPEHYLCEVTLARR
jgi:hypothetical protein